MINRPKENEEKKVKRLKKYPTIWEGKEPPTPPNSRVDLDVEVKPVGMRCVIL